MNKNKSQALANELAKDVTTSDNLSQLSTMPMQMVKATLKFSY